MADVIDGYRIRRDECVILNTVSALLPKLMVSLVGPWETHIRAYTVLKSFCGIISISTVLPMSWIYTCLRTSSNHEVIQTAQEWQRDFIWYSAFFHDLGTAIVSLCQLGSHVHTWILQTNSCSCTSSMEMGNRGLSHVWLPFLWPLPTGRSLRYFSTCLCPLLYMNILFLTQDFLKNLKDYFFFLSLINTSVWVLWMM